MKNICQSCSMPLGKDNQNAGTNADGTKSIEYCNKCYANGSFTEPNISLVEMQAKVKGIMREQMHMPGFVVGWFTRGIPKLRRWSQ